MKKQLLLALIAVAILTPQGFLSGESFMQKLKRKTTITKKGHEDLHKRRKKEILSEIQGDDRIIPKASSALDTEDKQKEAAALVFAKYKEIDALFRKYKGLREQNKDLQNQVKGEIARLKNENGQYAHSGIGTAIEDALKVVIKKSKDVLESHVKGLRPITQENPDLAIAWQLQQSVIHYEFQIKLLKEELQRIKTAVRIYDEGRTKFEQKGLQPIKDLTSMVIKEAEELTKNAKTREDKLLKSMESKRVE